MSSPSNTHKQEIPPPPDGHQHGGAYHQHPPPPPRYQQISAAQQHQHQPVQHQQHCAVAYYQQPHYQHVPHGESTGNVETRLDATAREHHVPHQIPAGQEVRYYVPQPSAHHQQQYHTPQSQIVYQYDPNTMAYQPYHPPQSDAYPPQPQQYQQQPVVQYQAEVPPPQQQQYPSQPREEPQQQQQQQQQQHNQQQQASFVIRGSAACNSEVQEENAKEDDGVGNQMLPPPPPPRPGKTVIQPNMQPNIVNATRKRKLQEDNSIPTTEENTKETVSKYEQEVNQQAESFSEVVADTEDEAADNNVEKFPFNNIMTTLQTYQAQHHSLSIPKSDPVFTKIMHDLVMNGIEEESDALWESYFEKLKDYKDRVGDCDVPVTDETLGQWVELQRKLYAKFHTTTSPDTNDDANNVQQLNSERYTTRFNRLSSIGFEFTTPLWDIRYNELLEYKAQHNNVTPPVDYPKLGIWVLNQRFNLKGMSKERVAALDAVGFLWNHNNQNRRQDKWDKKYAELLEYKKQNGDCNVPATYRHSPLGTWVSKQREEMKKLKDKKSSQLDMYRINKLNEINFQWRLQNCSVVSFDERLEALKEFKEKHGHVKIPRNHPDWGNWPNHIRNQYKNYLAGRKAKISKEKVEALLAIGFLEPSPQNEPGAV